MIELYSGTPGSGKSFHATEKIYYRLRAGKNVICNYDISINACRQNFFQYWGTRLFKRNVLGSKSIGSFEYHSNNDLTVEYLKEYARKHHKSRKEGQTLVVIDECGIMFNPRTFAQGDRLKWIEFLSLHRHYGYDFILISQSDRMLDRQIRAFIEYEHRHRKANNFGFGGMLISLLTHSTFFVDVKLWYGLREKVGCDWLRYSGRIASLYDTMYLEEEAEETNDTQELDSSSMGDKGGPSEDEPNSCKPISKCSLPFTDFSG